MSSERDSHPDVSTLLRALGQERATPRSADAEEERAAQFAARIDQQLAQLNRKQRRPTVHAWAALALAAALPLAWLGVASQRPNASLSITPEQKPPVETTHASASASTEPRIQPAQSPTRISGREPKKGVPQAGPIPAASVSVEPIAVEHPESPSTLGEENRLFGEAVAAAHSGEIEGALRGFDQLLSKYPGSPLSQTALVRRFRLLAKSGRTAEAVADARRYLEAYPTGFAVREAEAVARGEVAPSGSPSDEPRSP